MTCNEAEILLHGLLDGELDARHALDVEAHVAQCPKCAAMLATYRKMHQEMARSDMRLKAPAALRQRVEATLAVAPRNDRRAVLKGFAMGSVASALAATGLVALVLRNEDEQRILSDLTSAHLRSLQAGHLTDVLSTDQHTVRPWFNGRLDVAPPVVDLTARGFTLIGGRLDYLDGRAIGAVVYQRRTHVINLFVAQAPGNEPHRSKIDVVQGFNIWRWGDRGLNYWAISDLNKEELSEFGTKFETAVRG
jgi:anti-sigma factor RsiW